MTTYCDGPTKIGLRFGDDQADNIRACGYQRRIRGNLYRSAWAPIELLTWGQIAKMCLDRKSSCLEWPFFKADDEAADKQHTMDPARARLAMVALRKPDTVDRAAFPPGGLLFGAASAALRYNCFSRLHAALLGAISGPPFIGYLCDFGALDPSKLAPIALRSFERFCEIVGIQLRVDKTECANSLVLIGLKGIPETPERDAPTH